MQVEEVRVAMAMNGGVSLAVWMGGCAVELDCARRAHLGLEDAGPPKGPPAPRAVYHAITTAFRRELVPDILTGASAGGINGALLAGTMRAGRRLPPELLRRKWLELGDFSLLLYDTEYPAPDSIMQGKLFHDALEGMFKAVCASDDADADERDQTAPPDTQPGLERYPALLDVTMTNVEGEPRSFVDDWDEELSAREYRALIKFREYGDFTPLALADAARASASFPVAFAPFSVKEQTAGLAGLGGPRWAIDGGLLENAPITAALRLIPTRPAARRVRRFVCYVNADPPRHEPVKDDLPPPSLQNVLGYVVNIPRDARFVDQLTAIEQAKRRGTFSRENQLRLLTLDLEPLRLTAEALLEPYRARRFLLSLEDVLDNPGQARQVFESIGTPPGIPWIPRDLEPPLTGSAWQWGARTAERALYLQLDILRGAYDAADDATRERILTVRKVVDNRLTIIEAQRVEFMANDAVAALLRRLVGDKKPEYEIGALAQLTAEYSDTVVSAVRAATEALFGVKDTLGSAHGQSLAVALFGQESSAQAFGDDAFANFLTRALSIEVVRRAFFAEEDIETGQNLRFAQLTPLAPSRIFAAKPLREPGPDSPENKLTGIRLGHFAGFYRRSWRANDFMWGRLDAATRIVDMLVDGERARELAGSGRTAVWATLAGALVPEGAEPAAVEHRRLVHEALVDARTAAPGLAPEVSKAVEGYGDAEPGAGELRAALERALAADLTHDDRAFFTRVVCARAVQLEIVRQELPVVVTESHGDRKLGAFTDPLPFAARDEVFPAIERLRKDKLPLLLGRDPPEWSDEAASSLALGTVSHAGFVGLSTLRTAGLPLVGPLSIARAVLLPLAGLSSRRAWHKGAVLLGFVAAAFYVTARLVTATGESAPLGALWSPEVWLTVVAELAIAAVVGVPALRAWRSRRTAWRIEQAGWALLLLAAAAGVAAVLAKLEGGLGFADLLVTPGADAPNDVIVWIGLVVIVGPLLVLAKWLPGWLLRPAERIVRRAPVAALAGIAAIATLVWSGPELWDALLDGERWKQVAAACAAATPVVGALYLLIGNRR